MSLTVGTNAYLDLTDAGAYFADRLHSEAWHAATPEQRAQAIVTATRAIDRVPMRGRKKQTGQTLEFPRCYDVPPPDYAPQNDWTHVLYGDTAWCDPSTPQAVLDAVCEEAIARLERGNSTRRKLQLEGVIAYRAGNTSESYAAGQTGVSVSPAELLSLEARTLLRPYAARSAKIA